MQNNHQTTASVLRIMQLIFFTALIMYFGKTLFIPLFFGLLIAIVMYPVCKWLEAHGWNKALSITACLFIVTILFVLLFVILLWQIKILAGESPEIINGLKAALPGVQKWLINIAGVSISMDHISSEEFFSVISSMLGAVFQNAVNTLFILFLTPVYTALIMYHRKVLVQYLRLITPVKYNQQLDVILRQTVHTYFNYIKGMVLVYLIVGILNSIGLFALGVNHALLFGMLCAIMTIIPYIGIFISALLPITVAWIDTGNIWYPVAIVAIFGFVQYLEANIIFPKVVGTQLNVSTLAMLVAIIAGGIIWGVAGMVLFIPFVAILKIITDNVEEWKAINLLLSR
ncbi:MAG TPA: AI-2E family transporter [Panacibacter sp.]|nr:AI-2E family transporter [Panacibacter sp.]